VFQWNEYAEIAADGLTVQQRTRAIKASARHWECEACDDHQARAKQQKRAQS